MSRIQEVIARVEAAGAEPSTEAAGEASQTDGAASAEGSASADVSTPAAPDAAPSEPAVSTSPEAPTTPTEDELQAKLAKDRERRRVKELERQAKSESEARRRLEQQLKERDERDAARKTKPWLERIREDGEDPRKAFEEMKAEALKAGTPEAQIEAMTKAFDAKISTLEATLKAEREERQRERENIQKQQAAHAFRSDFDRALKIEHFQPLLDEYPDPEDMFPIVEHLKDNPAVLFGHAERLGVDLGLDLTDPDVEFNMLHILQVMRAQQDAHNAKRAAAKQKAAPPQSQPAQPAEAKKPTVNGAEVRKAGTTIGNDLAASSAGAPPDAVHEDHKQRLKRLIEKYG
jgi:hypothetical protein